MWWFVGLVPVYWVAQEHVVVVGWGCTVECVY